MTETGDLLARAAAHMTPNYAPPPFVLAHGKGALLHDTEGREYLDFAGGIGVTPLGHSHPRVVAAIAEQASLLCHASNAYYHVNYIRMCTRIAELSFGDRVFLASTGTEAVEASLKLARRFFHERGEPRTGFVAARNSFHGRTLGALSVTGQPMYQQGFGPLLPDVAHVPYGDLAAMRDAVGPSTAAVILEPIQGNGGVVVPPAGYLPGVRAICDQNGALLIFDEVQTGIGRTGRWFAYEHEGVAPDIMALAKMLGGGLPLGAMVTTTQLARALKPGSHATTFGGNAVACAAGLAALEVIAEEGLLDNATRLGERLRRELMSATGRQVRGRGLMVGLVVEGAAKALQQACLGRGLLTTTAGPNVLRLLPPLNIISAEVTRAVETITAGLSEKGT